MAHNVLTVGTTALPLAPYALPVTGPLRLKAEAGNSTNLVYVGQGSDVSSANGYELSAGNELELSPAFAATTDLVWCVGSTSGLKVCWVLQASAGAYDTAGWALDFSSPHDSGLLPVLF